MTWAAYYSVSVHGELDWSPNVHRQADGRLARDGQQSPVMAYYPVSNEGSDPIMIDILGIKREQADGVLDPNAPLVEAAPDPREALHALARRHLGMD